MIDEPHRDHPPMEGPAAGAQTATPLGSHSPECGPQHGLRGGAGEPGGDSRNTRPDRATRFVETTSRSPRRNRSALIVSTLRRTFARLTVPAPDRPRATASRHHGRAASAQTPSVSYPPCLPLWRSRRYQQSKNAPRDGCATPYLVAHARPAVHENRPALLRSLLCVPTFRPVMQSASMGPHPLTAMGCGRVCRRGNLSLSGFASTGPRCHADREMDFVHGGHRSPSRARKSLINGSPKRRPRLFISKITGPRLGISLRSLASANRPSVPIGTNPSRSASRLPKDSSIIGVSFLPKAKEMTSRSPSSSRELPTRAIPAWWMSIRLSQSPANASSRASFASVHPPPWRTSSRNTADGIQASEINCLSSSILPTLENATNGEVSSTAEMEVSQEYESPTRRSTCQGSLYSHL